MTTLAGFSWSGHSPAPLHLAAQLSRCTGGKIVAAAVIERPWLPNPMDNEYFNHIGLQAEKALEHAIAQLPPGLDVWPIVHQATSVPEGLTELATEVKADTVVVGSSSTGLLGRIALGSATDRLVHTAEIPVAIAPRGYPAHPGRIERLTVAYGGQADHVGLVAATAELAARWSVRLRIASFTVRPMSVFSGSLEPGADDLVIAQWARQTRVSVEEQLEAVRSGVDTVEADVVIGSGSTWRDAVDGVGWETGDILVLGSGAAGPVAQVFLGSAAARILRHSPVPTMIMPRRTAA